MEGRSNFWRFDFDRNHESLGKIKIISEWKEFKLRRYAEARNFNGSVTALDSEYHRSALTTTGQVGASSYDRSEPGYRSPIFLLRIKNERKTAEPHQRHLQPAAIIITDDMFVLSAVRSFIVDVFSIAKKRKGNNFNDSVQWKLDFRWISTFKIE